MEECLSHGSGRDGHVKVRKVGTALLLGLGLSLPGESTAQAPAVQATVAQAPAAQAPVAQAPVAQIRPTQSRAGHAFGSDPAVDAGTPLLAAIADVLSPRDSSNLPVLSDRRVRVRGVLTTAPRPAGRSSDLANLQDVTAGIVLFAADTLVLAPFTRGDSVEVVGELSHNQGMEEIRVETIRWLGQGAIPDPIDIAAAELHSERYSGRLVRVSGRIHLEGGSAGDAFVVDETGRVPVYVRRDYLDNQAFARSLYEADRGSVVGIASQQDFEPPYDEGYDLIPRGPSDFALRPPPPYLWWAAASIGAVLLALALYAWLRRARAEERANLLARLTRDLERREAVLAAVAFAGARFLEDDGVALPLDAILGRLVEATPADEAAVLPVAGGRAESPTDGPVGAGGDTSGLAALERYWKEAARAGEWRDWLSAGDCLEIPSADDPLPPELLEADIRGLLLVPVFVEGSLRAALAFWSARDSRWPAAAFDALNAAAAIIGAALGRRDTRHALRAQEEQLRQAQKLEAVGRLAGGIAHDFNNLLTAIGGNGALLAADPEVDHDHRQIGNAIVDNVQRGTRLVRQLLAFSRRQALPNEPQDAAAVVRELRPMLERLLDDEILLETRLAASAWTDLPPGQLEQILMNLVLNSRDAMPEGGRIRITVERVELRDGPEVVLEVEDTGEGMEEETIAHVFDPFFTTKSSGSGLGLSIVYGIVRQAGGSVDIRAARGEGTRVMIRFPARVAPLRRQEEPTGSSPAPVREATILLAEDEAAVRSLARRVLEKHGHTVLEAENGHQAREIFNDQSDRIDLLLTDVRMPHMNGAELARSIAIQGHEIPVLYMSGYAAEDLSLEDLERERYLEKPFTPKQLLEQVGELLNGPLAGEHERLTAEA
jgi:signal transduction histidine kinase/CheY-like chemotaxis protein